MDQSSAMKRTSHAGGSTLSANVGLGMGSGSALFNSNASLGSFSVLQDFPFFGESLGDFSLAALQSLPSIPDQILQEGMVRAAAAAASGQASGQQGSTSNLTTLNLNRNDSFFNLTQSSLQNLQLFLADLEQQPNSSADLQQLLQLHQQQQLQLQQQQSSNAPATINRASGTAVQPNHNHHVAQTLPAHGTMNPPATLISKTQSPITPSLPPLKAGPAPMAAPPIYPSPSQFASFASPYNGYSPIQPHVAPSLGIPQATRQAETSTKNSGQAGPAVQEFSSTLYSLASTLPPPMVLSNDAVLGSVGGGLHFQRHCVRRRMPDELVQDPNIFFN